MLRSVSLGFSAGVVVLLLLSGCSEGTGDGLEVLPADTSPDTANAEPADATDAEADSSVEYLSPMRHLIRASMVLRGLRPSAAELKTVRDDPSALPAFVAAYVDTPEFGDTVRDLENETLWLRAENKRLPNNAEAVGISTYDLNREMFEGALKLIENVVMSDLPYTEIVTADYLMVTESGAAAWQGLEPREPDGPKWQAVGYFDGRPASGILSDGTFFFRYGSNGINHHRGRANAISRALLCYDFLENDIVLIEPIDLSDEEAVALAVVENSACASCHQALDPLASFIWGIKGRFAPNKKGFPMQYWEPNEIEKWKKTSGRPPALFGKSGAGQQDLGPLIAADPRFSRCAATRYFSYFTQTPMAEVSWEVSARFQATLVDSGYDIKALAQAIALSDEFRVSHADSDDVAETLRGLSKARPEQLDRMFRGLTGLDWQTKILGKNSEIIDLATSDHYGFRVLAGGIDSHSVFTPVHTMSATSSLFLRAMANEAASRVVTFDLAEPEPSKRTLLTELPGDDFEDEEAVRAQLAALHLVVLGEDVGADSSEVGESYALFTAALAASNDPKRAWIVTLTGLFQDLRVATY